MSRYALLTLDLPGAPADKRAKFNAAMEKRNWKKRRAVTTAWSATFKDTTDDDAIIRSAKSSVAASVKAAGLTKYHLYVMGSDTKWGYAKGS